jgi:hypothetical protein
MKNENPEVRAYILGDCEVPDYIAEGLSRFAELGGCRHGSVSADQGKCFCPSWRESS